MAFDFTTLIRDRTLNNVLTAKLTIQRLKDGTATQEEIDSYNNGLKGCYNATDLNRVGEAVEELATILNNSLGFAVVVNPKTDWTSNDIPSVTELTTYLENIRVLMTAIEMSSSQLPQTMAFLDYIKANRIEEILYTIWQWTEKVIPNFKHSGTVFAYSGLNGLVL